MPRQTQAFESTQLTYPSGDAQVAGRLYRPLQLVRPAPVVVYCPGSAQEIATMEAIPQALARHGYMTLATEYRGSRWDDDDADVAAAIDFLTAQPEVNREQVALVGHFRGGAAALRTAAKDKRVKSVVSLAAPVFLAQWVNGVRTLSEINYQDHLKLVGGVPEEQAQRYADLSALFAARSIKAATLIIHGAADLFVPIDQSVWMFVQLSQSGNTNPRLELVPWAGHYFDDVLSGRYMDGEGLTGSFKDHVAGLAVDWLDETLGRRF